jgi:hypothetical protein
MTTRPRPLPPDPQAEPSSPRERVIARALDARATIDPFASASLRRGLRLGRHFGAAWCLKILMHPQWLTELRAPIPRREVTFTEPAEVTEEQLALCERIARAYQAARGDPNDLSPIWSGKVTRYYGTLERALTAGDPRALNEQFRWLFRRPFLAGISTPIDYEDPGAPRYWALVTYDRLASLAEAVGVLRTESPEQGPVGRVFTEGLDALPARIEAALEISLDHPRVGAPYGILIGGRLITRETSVYLLAAMWLREAIAVHLRRSPAEEAHIVEIGGGYGGAAMWYLRLPRRHQGSYTIVDLPLMNAFQAYFLGQVHGERALPPQVLTGPQPIVADVVYNQDCLPELSERTAREYLAWMQAHVRGVFLSCNQEAAAPVGGVPQLVVAELASEYPGLTRIARRPSWQRRGYVEEVYRCGAR